LEKRLKILLLAYSIAVAVSFVLCLGVKETEWYSFYAYLDSHGAVPYIDTREGYPPLGFLSYMPIYYAFRGNIEAFTYGFRALNCVFLVATLYALYLILESQFGENRSLRLTLYYAGMPFVIIAGFYSNDVLSLLPAALGIYMMVKKRPLLCGFLLGLAALEKGFPIVLIIPGLIAFTNAKDRLKLLSATLLTLVFVSLPFVLINPFTYVSTFTYVSSRGPWETVWAFIDGFYSHGGLLHPYFDKFFYHFDLLKIYSASPYDQAIYQWRFGFIPDLLTALQILVIGLVSLIYTRRKKEYVALCGLLYISYMLFFKGYSPQFSIATLFFVLLAVSSAPLMFMIPLEVSQVMQMMAWSMPVYQATFRNWHFPLLESAIVIRTVVFAIVVLTAFKGTRITLKQVTEVGRQLTGLLRRFLGWSSILKDKWIAVAISAMIVTALVSATSLYGYMNDPSGFRSFEGEAIVTQSDWQNITINSLEKGDQVMVKLATNTWFDAKLANSTVQVEQGVRNPDNFEGSFNETMLFFRAESDSHTLMLRMKHPKMPFRVTEGLEGDLIVNATTEDSALTLILQDQGLDGNASTLTLAYPLSVHVDNNFSLHLRYRLVEGNVSNVRLSVFDDTDYWLYSYAPSEDFVLTSESKDLYGHSNILSDYLSLVAVSISLHDNTSATVRLDELSVGSENYSVKFYATPYEEVSYEVFIERDFKSSINYATALISTVTLGTLTIWYLYEKMRRVQKLPV
jgi:hypothetical protein